MDWKAIGTLYHRLFEEARKRGETQYTVGARGGLRQNDISRLLENGKKGPVVETFVKAVEGLGISVSAFFARIEGDSTTMARVGPVVPPPKGGPNDLPAFESEERIAASVLRRLTQLALKGVEASEDERAEDHRLPANARPLAAERSTSPRTDRPRDVQPPKKRGSPPRKRSGKKR